MLIRSLGGAAARLLFAALAIFTLSAAADAAFITYAASNGNDANPCTVVTAPCKTLQRAVSVASANGTVRVLTPLQNSVTIAKSITISGDGVPIVGQITIAGATAVVTLRGLALNGVGGYSNGIRIDSAAAVHIEDCTVERYTSDGIRLLTTAATKLFILNTVSRDNAGIGDGLHAEADNATVEIVNSHFDGNANTGVFLKVAKANVTRSGASRNGQHGFLLRSPQAKITETTADDNSVNGFDVSTGSAALGSAETNGNGTAGLYIESVATAITTDCAFINTSTSVTANGVNNLGTWFWRQNDAIFGDASGNPPIPF